MIFTAKKEVGKLTLKADGIVFGYLMDCEVTWIFESNDEQLQYYVNDKLSGDMPVSEMLVVVKEVFIGVQSQYDGEAAFERSCERAYYNMIETDDESRDEMEREDAMGMS